MNQSGKYLLLFILLFTVGVRAQQNGTARKDTFIVRESFTFSLSGISIIPNSVKAFLKNEVLSEEQFAVDYRMNQITLNESAKAALLDTLIAVYKIRDLGLKKKYSRRELVIKTLPESPDTIRVIKKTESEISTKTIFGEEIQKSGTILRGFTVGTNKDFTVNSGLRLQLSGKLSDDLEIVAALTDENTPIQPEGNTERLEELDKVFIEVRHPYAVGVFGDYEYNLNFGEFGKISRKLQGLKGTVNAWNSNLSFAIAGTRGKFNTNEFEGIDGVQGPYRLTGANNERNIIIIAGSEKVFLDGKEMRRGENNDYVIEYANGELTFTTSRLITSASRIIIDFEYTDRQFDRNFAGMNLESKLADNLSLNLSLMQEGDDQNSPIDFTFSDAEMDALSTAGDDRNKASVDGASLAEPDSNGIRKGAYAKIDTMILGEFRSIYRYAPGTAGAIYNVSFSYVGAGKGDYLKKTLGNYEFAGIGLGDYLPVKFLAVPQLRQNANLLLDYRPAEKLKIQLEASGSIADQNRFSYIDDGDNSGFAYNLSLGYLPGKVTIAGADFGQLGANFRQRYKNTKYSPIYRIDEIEFERNYNSTSSSGGDELLREFSLNYSVENSLTVSAQYGSLKRGNAFSSDRLLTITSINKFGFRLAHQLDYVASDNSVLGSDWMRQNGSVEYSGGFASPGLSFLYENKLEKPGAQDSLGLGSLKYEEVSPFVRLNPFEGLGIVLSATSRNEYFPLAGEMVKESGAVGKSVDLNFSSGRELQTEFTFTQRTKSISDQFKLKGRTGSESILIRNRTRTNLLKGFVSGSVYYEAATQKTSKLEKVFIKVTKGTGNYIYLGDLNNNGIAEYFEYEPAVFDGEYILVTIPSDELIPVIDLKVNTRWILNFGKLISGRGFWNDIFSPISTETFYRVEENSRESDPKKIYLFHSESFLNDTTTIRGFNLFQNDFHLFRNSREFSLRYRFVQRRSLNNFSGGLEKGFFKEQGFRVRFRMIEEVSNETEFTSGEDDLSVPPGSRRARQISTAGLNSDFSYKPYRNVEVGFKFSTSESEDRYPSVPTKINTNSQTLRLILAFANKGRIRAEAERVELSANVSSNYIPFEITKGNRLGKNYFWRLNLDYKIASNLQMSLNYDGRILGGSDTVHTMRAEAKAYF